MKIFKKIDGTKVDVVKHTLNIMKDNPNMQVYIGTDSQTSGHITTYATVIAYRFGNTGVHYIFTREKFPRINDMWTRLWKEAELTQEVANWFTQKINLKVELDLDYNDDNYFKSNQLISAAKGWLSSMGYKVNTKPECLIAARAANERCR